MEEWRRSCKSVDIKEDFAIGKVIGNGSFSTVSECTQKSTGLSFEVKAISKKLFKDKQCKGIENEIKF